VFLKLLPKAHLSLSLSLHNLSLLSCLVCFLLFAIRLEWTIEIFMYLHMQRILGLGFSTFQNRGSWSWFFCAIGEYG
jgi:hypothetical protein